MPKISILMPAFNVEEFLRECVDSVVKQTLKDIEIICIDDGSTDRSGEILDEYAKNDSRIKVIHKANSGYGHSMNQGLKAATGEYIGIVETDDYVDADMFERLYKAAVTQNADMVKSNYYTYVSKPEPKSEFLEVLKPYDKYNEIFEPAKYQEVMRVKPCIWSGIYKRQMLIENDIWFTETPGASYQDTSFAFKVWVSAKRAYLLKEAFLHYRIDNANSSVKSSAKIFCLCDEYKSSEEFLEKNPEKKKIFEKMKNSLKYESYRWNLQRLTLEFKYAFLVQMQREFREEKEKKLLDKAYFTDWAWKNMNRIIDNIDLYYMEECRGDLMGYSSIQDMANEIKKLKSKEKALLDVYHSTSFRIGRGITYLPRKFRNLCKR